MDKATATGIRLAFARLCVEVNLESILPSEVTIEYKDMIFTRAVEYACRPNPCKRCQTFNHGETSCPMKGTVKQAWVPKSKNTEASEAPITDNRGGDQRNNAQKNLQESDGFTIVDKGRKSPSPSKASKQSENSDPNRLQCLSNLDGNSQVEENEIIDTTSLIERVGSSSSGVGTCSYLGSDSGKAVGANFVSGSNRSSWGIVIRGEPQQTKRV